MLNQEDSEKARLAELNAVVADIKRAIAAFGLTAEDLGLADTRTGQPSPELADSNDSNVGRIRRSRWRQ